MEECASLFLSLLFKDEVNHSRRILTSCSQVSYFVSHPTCDLLKQVIMVSSQSRKAVKKM